MNVHKILKIINQSSQEDLGSLPKSLLPMCIVKYPFVNQKTKVLIVGEFFLQPLDTINDVKAILKITKRRIIINKKIISEFVEKYIIKSPRPKSKVVHLIKVLRKFVSVEDFYKIEFDIDYMEKQLMGIFVAHPYLRQKFIEVKELISTKKKRDKLNETKKEEVT